MTNTLAEKRNPEHSITSDAKDRSASRLWQVSLAIFIAAFYLALYYAFNPLKTKGGAKSIIHFAIVLLDVSISLQLFGLLKAKFASPNVERKHLRWLRPLFFIFGASAILFQLDYIHSRSIWSEVGVFGPVQRIKEYTLLSLIMAQLIGLIYRYSSYIKVNQNILLTKITWPQKSLQIAGFLLLIVTPLLQLYLTNKDSFFHDDALKFFLFLLGGPILIATILVSLESKQFVPIWVLPTGLSIICAHFHSPIFNALIKNSPDNSIILNLLPIVLFAELLAAISIIDRKVFLGFACLYFLVPVFDSAFLKPKTVNSSDATETVRGDLSPDPLTKLVQAPDDTGLKPNVFFLIYDGYANQNLMKRYGIDNSNQLSFLSSSQFTIYSDAYSQYLATLGSIGRVMNMSTTPQFGIAGPNRVNKFFHQLGYETNLILSPYFYQETPQIEADQLFPPRDKISQFNTLMRGIAVGEFRADFVFSEYSNSDWLEAKRRGIVIHREKPIFMYAHSGFPGHSQNSGQCLADETELFKKRLAIANEEMRYDIDLILKHKKNSVIIVASDHGPSLTGDCLYLNDRSQNEVTGMDLADRYGVLLAIKWPSEKPYKYSQPAILQDLFFNVFAYVSQNPKILDYRLPRSTFGYGSTITDKAINDGKIKIGRDQGKNLYESI